MSANERQQIRRIAERSCDAPTGVGQPEKEVSA